MPLSASLGKLWIYADSIVADTQSQVCRVRKLNPQLAGMRVHTRVADCFVPNAVDLITDDGMHLLRLADHGKRGLHRILQSTFFDRPPERCGQIVSL